MRAKRDRDLSVELRNFNDNIRKEYAAAILKYGEDHNLTKEELAEKLDISIQTLYNFIKPRKSSSQSSIDILYNVAKNMNRKLLITLL